jgi:hypothetical protein
MTATPTPITIERGETFYRNSSRPWRTDYSCVGPDGTVFKGHTHKAALLSLLRQRYGKIEITIIDGPTWRTRP